MAFALLIIGLALVTVTVRNTQDTFTARVANDFRGPGNFVYWIVAILIIGSVGYVKKLKGLSDAFLVMVLLVLILKRGNPGMPAGGFFQQFTNAIKGTTGSATSSPGVSVKVGG